MNFLAFSIIGISITLALLAINKFVIKKYLIKEDAETEDLRQSYTTSSPTLGTINWIGFTFLGCYRYYSGTFVTYRFLSFVLPIIPLGCYRVKDVTEQESSSPYEDSKYYQIFGKESWRFWEVLHIYIQRYASMALVWFCLAFIFELIN